MNEVRTRDQAPPSCALSVVVASIDAERSIGRSLESIERACRGLECEILVVDASSDRTVSIIEASGARVRLSRLPSGTLTPKLWSAGLAMSRGRIVAFTTGHFTVSDTWARALMSGIEQGATGVSGRLSAAADGRPLDWAMFYLRYSAFLGVAEQGTENAAEIPADNAAYRRDALDRHAATFADGFWEVDFHRRLRGEGARLAFVPGADVSFGPSSSIAALARQRFAHGCHSGFWRVQTGMRTAWQAAVAAPLVPVVLITRIARRVLPRPADRGRFVRALPGLFVLATAWAAGEARGALASGRHQTASRSVPA